MQPQSAAQFVVFIGTIGYSEVGYNLSRENWEMRPVFTFSLEENSKAFYFLIRFPH